MRVYDGVSYNGLAGEVLKLWGGRVNRVGKAFTHEAAMAIAWKEKGIFELLR
jgi:hypothetical protein